MSFEIPKIEQGESRERPVATVEVERGYEQFIPPEFRDDPIGYFERGGRNVKPGEVKRNEAGRIREDPTAVKELPIWRDSQGNELRTIGKRVNVEKGEVGKSGDSFYEYRILQIVHELGLPAPRPIAKSESGNKHLIVMERAAGVNWYERGYTDEDIENLKRQAEKRMLELKRQFDEVGIIRGWKLKDMVFDVDVGNKQILGITPVDWERTKIDQVKLEKARRKRQKSA